MESGESGKLQLEFAKFAKFARPPSKLNSTAISENVPLRRSSKMELGTPGESTMNSVELKRLLQQSAFIFSDPKIQKIDQLKMVLNDLEYSLSCIQKQIDNVDLQVYAVSYVWCWLLVGVSILQMAFFYYCIFHVEWLGWDIMEPLTYSALIVSWVAAMRFYGKVKKPRNFENIFGFRQMYYFNRFPMVRLRYNNLLESKIDVENDIKYLRKNVEFYKNGAKETVLHNLVELKI